MIFICRLSSALNVALPDTGTSLGGPPSPSGSGTTSGSGRDADSSTGTCSSSATSLSPARYPLRTPQAANQNLLILSKATPLRRPCLLGLRSACLGVSSTRAGCPTLPSMALTIPLTSPTSRRNSLVGPVHQPVVNRVCDPPNFVLCHVGLPSV